MRRHSRRGSVLILVLALGMVMTAMVWSGLATFTSETVSSIQEERSDQARASAEAALQWTAWKLEKDPSYTGEKGRSFATGTFDVLVEGVAGHPSVRNVRVVGRWSEKGFPSASSAFTGRIERVDARGGAVWRRLSWRVDTSTR